MNLDFDKLSFHSRASRSHKVDASLLAGAPPVASTFSDWFDALPDVLGARELRAVVGAIVAARRAQRPVVFAYGGHVLKTGCGPVLIDLMRQGVITGLATNGSGAIHDLELAETGATSEEVGDTIRDGAFGMVRETCERMNDAAQRGADGVGLGRAVGELLREREAPYAHQSPLAVAAELDLPATVHVTLGADTVHMHPRADGAAIGAATLADFRRFCGVVAELGAEGSEDDAPGGVFVNCGSAVTMPEVFLKAVSVVRNLGRPLRNMHTANFDMLTHYRPLQNVVRRPVAAGFGHNVVGQHEIMLPLLRQAIIERRSNTP